ncbi:hypothetical protein [Hymenobacter glaciei]|uniref:hypothetical protein n=1 Tax=Hymenobacter glaciei TaxID=877209 RepID=UPI0031F0C1EE
MNPFYQSNRKFVLSDALVSHGQLLLRADKIDGSQHNEDVIFFDTLYLQLPTYFNTLRLFRRPADKPIGYERIDKALANFPRHYQLFELSSEAES